MKRLSQINEGLWKPGINRAKSNTVRKEDYIDTNVKEFKEVDLGFDFVFADKPLVSKGKDVFTYKEAKEITDFTNKYYGWRLISLDDLYKAFVGENDEIKSNIVITCKNRFEKRIELFNTHLAPTSKHILYLEMEKWGDLRIIMESDKEYSEGNRVLCWNMFRTYKDPDGINMGTTLENDDVEHPVILIKDKK